MTRAHVESGNVEGGSSRKDERQWRDLFEHNPSMCFMIDNTGSVRLATSSGAGQLGYEAGELAGRPFADLVFEDDRELVRRHIVACLDTIGRSHSWEARQIGKDKAVLWVRHNAKAVRWSSSQLIVLLACEDITLRHGQDLELARLAAIVASSDDAIVSKTLDGVVTSWNAGASRIFGYQASEMIGQSIFRIIPSELHREEREILARLRRGERLQHYETVRVTKDGRRVDISLTVSPLVDRSGRLMGASKVARDITEAKAAARGERESAARLAAVIDTAVDGVILIDGGGAVLVFNPVCERLFGYPATDVIGRNVNMLMPDPHRRDHDRYISDYLASRRPKIIGSRRELTGRRKDGSTFPMSLSVGEARQERGSIFVGIIHDLTEAKRTEADLQQARTELARVARVTSLGELTAAIAHEVNQPLTGLVSSGNACLRWLAADSPDLEAARGSVRRMISAGNRAVEIIGRIRALVGKAAAQRTQFGMNAAILEVITFVDLEMQRNHVVLETHLAGDLPDVWGDRIQLQQVILNLVLNGIEAMNERGGELRISTILDGEEVKVSVSDTGVGIPADKMDQVFNEFFTTKVGGTGMGLAISRDIIESHGGRLWATANQEHGATFHFALPTKSEARK